MLTPSNILKSPKVWADVDLVDLSTKILWVRTDVGPLVLMFPPRDSTENFSRIY